MKALKSVWRLHFDVGLPVLLALIIGVVVSPEDGYVVRNNGEFIGINTVLWAVGAVALLLLWWYGTRTRRKLKAEIKEEILAEVRGSDSVNN